MNDTTITGRFTKDPELRKTKTGKSVCNFDLAVRRIRKKTPGATDSAAQNNKQDVDFIRCVAWEDTAEKIAKFFSKGRLILVRGAFHNNKSVSQKDGKTYNNTELHVSNFEFMDDKRSGGGSNAPAGAASAPDTGIPTDDKDIPI